MKLRNRQILAVKKTLEQIIREYLGHKEHSWDISNCPLCKMFKPTCVGCPLAFDFENTVYHRCEPFLRDNEAFTTSLQDIAGFLMSLLVSLKEMRGE